MKKRLLIFHPAIAPYRIDLFNDLCEAFNTQICLRKRFDIFEYERIESQLNFTPLYLQERSKTRVGMFFDIWRQIRGFQPDIVLTSEFGLVTLLALICRMFLCRSYKVVSVCDDSYNMLAENNDFSCLHRVGRNLLAHKVDELILVEPRAVKWYQRCYGKGIFFPIIRREDNAIATYRRLLPQSRTLQKQLDLCGKRVFLFVGRLVALKNVTTILSAFEKIQTENDVMVIVGSGEEESNLKHQADNMSGRVLFTGRLEGDELYAWYNISNCFILASYQEPFGAVVNEALLAGCWCLVSEKAGSNCLIKEGENGACFNPYDVEKLADLMDKVRPVHSRMNGMFYHYMDILEQLVYNLNKL